MMFLTPNQPQTIKRVRPESRESNPDIQDRGKGRWVNGVWCDRKALRAYDKVIANCRAELAARGGDMNRGEKAEIEGLKRAMLRRARICRKALGGVL